MDNKQLGQRLKFVREIKKISLEELASLVGLNKSTISRYERGEIDNPKLPVIQALGDALHVNPLWLIGKSDDMTYTPPGGDVTLYRPSNLFSHVKILRKSKEQSPQDVAFAIGISKDDYLKIESGYNTDCVTLIALANYFCCSTDFILSYEGEIVGEAPIPYINSRLFRLHQAFKKLDANYQEKVISFAQCLDHEEQQQNIINIAARDGSFSTLTLTDKQLSKFKETIDQLPDIPDGL